MKQCATDIFDVEELRRLRFSTSECLIERDIRRESTAGLEGEGRRLLPGFLLFTVRDVLRETGAPHGTPA